VCVCEWRTWGFVSRFSWRVHVRVVWSCRGWTRVNYLLRHNYIRIICHSIPPTATPANHHLLASPPWRTELAMSIAQLSVLPAIAGSIDRKSMREPSSLCFFRFVGWSGCEVCWVVGTCRGRSQSLGLLWRWRCASGLRWDAETYIIGKWSKKWCRVHPKAPTCITCDLCVPLKHLKTRWGRNQFFWGFWLGEPRQGTWNARAFWEEKIGVDVELREEGRAGVGKKLIVL